MWMSRNMVSWQTMLHSSNYACPPHVQVKLAPCVKVLCNATHCRKAGAGDGWRTADPGATAVEKRALAHTVAAIDKVCDQGSAQHD